MKGSNGQIVGFLSLEDFAADVRCSDEQGPVRVQPIRRSTGGKLEHSKVQWIILVTALTAEGVAMASILTGQRWEIFEGDDRQREENAEMAAVMIQGYLEGHGFVVAPGVYSPQAVMDNIVHAGCNLWRFKDGQLVCNLEADLEVRA